MTENPIMLEPKLKQTKYMKDVIYKIMIFSLYRKLS